MIMFMIVMMGWCMRYEIRGMGYCVELASWAGPSYCCCGKLEVVLIARANIWFLALEIALAGFNTYTQ